MANAKRRKKKKKDNRLAGMIFISTSIVLLIIGIGSTLTNNTDETVTEALAETGTDLSNDSYTDEQDQAHSNDRYTVIVPGMERQAYIDVENIRQEPELPTGCEITSLTMVLNYLGHNVSKETMADVHLLKAEPGTASFNEAFLGNPRDDSSYGCYAPVIVDAAESYNEAAQAGLEITNHTGESLETMLTEVARGNPVIIWGSMRIEEEVYYTTTWFIDGEELRWLAPEHCMVLIGYDLDAGTVTVCDPLRDIEEYEIERFEEHYNAFGRMAVTIK